MLKDDVTCLSSKSLNTPGLNIPNWLFSGNIFIVIVKLNENIKQLLTVTCQLKDYIYECKKYNQSLTITPIKA